MFSSSFMQPKRSNLFPNPLRSLEQRLFFLIGDGVIASISLGLAAWFNAYIANETFGVEDLFNKPAWFYLIAPGWLLILHSLYDHRKLHDSLSTARSLAAMAALATGIYLIIFFFSPPGRLPRLIILCFIVIAFALTLAWRQTNIRWAATRRRRLLVIGAGWAGQTIAETVSQLQTSQFEIAGFIDDNPLKLDKIVCGYTVLADHSNLTNLVGEQNIAYVVLAITGDIQAGMFQALMDCVRLGVEVITMTDLYEHLTGRVPIHHLGTTQTLAVSDYFIRESFISIVFRRTVDIALAVPGLSLLGLVYVPVALAIWLEDHGPIIYTQTRLGKDGKRFRLVKFRTMSPDAEADGNPRWAEAYDERVTGIGRLLRKIRLDELPQFWNVFQGDMGVIGPRPERPELSDKLIASIPLYRARLAIKPGLTGWAQVNYGYAATVESNAIKLQYDLYYLKNRSIWLDLLILWRTIITIIRLEGT